MYPLEVYTWLNFKGILQYVPSPSSPCLRPTGAQLPYCTNQPFLNMWLNWVPQALFPKNLLLEAGTFSSLYVTLEDMWTWKRGLSHGQPQCPGTQRKPRCWEENAGGGGAAEVKGWGWLLSSWSLPDPNLSVRHTPLLLHHQILTFTSAVSCGCWCFVTKRTLRQPLQPTLTTWKASKTASLWTLKNNNTAMTMRGF